MYALSKLRNLLFRLYAKYANGFKKIWKQANY